MDRGVVAVRSTNGTVFVSWRLLVGDAEDVAFDVYRLADAAESAERINPAPIADATCFVDENPLDRAQYTVRVAGQQPADESAHDRWVLTWENGYLDIPIALPDDYRPGDASVADLDGDGQQELVVHLVSRPRDNSHSGITGRPLLDGYEFDGTRLWRIDLGINIREGEHYTQFLVYDLDGDGRAEVTCKTADGTRDGVGQVLGDGDADWRTLDAQSPAFGRVLAGPEYLTVFDGKTGAALATVDYEPSREPINGWGGIGGNGGNDQYGNRCDRFLACVAFLDGKRPSAVLCRGVYGRTVLVAWDWREGQLTRRWTFDSGVSYPPFDDASPYSGMGGHSLAVADVDGDGRDEIIYHAMVINDDGRGLYTTGWRHGDALHVADMDPSRPGLEVLTVHENEGWTVRLNSPGVALRDAATGERLWSHSHGVDVPSGLAADVDPRYEGYEVWGGPGGMRSVKGAQIGPAPRTSDFAIWWDGDLLRELLGRRRVTKWNWEAGREETIFSIPGRGPARGPNLMGDLIGDWREEFLTVAPEGRALRLYTTTIATAHRMVTLMQDPQYRLGIVWQNAAYNQPPHPSFYLGTGPPGGAPP